jgi:hypothetical protein
MTHAEIHANAHLAHTLSRLSVGYLSQADMYPHMRASCLAEAKRLREDARWYLARAKRLKARQALALADVLVGSVN